MQANFEKQEKDEIGVLVEAIDRMKCSLQIAMNMLKHSN